MPWASRPATVKVSVHNNVVSWLTRYVHCDLCTFTYYHTDFHAKPRVDRQWRAFSRQESDHISYTWWRWNRNNVTVSKTLKQTVVLCSNFLNALLKVSYRVLQVDHELREVRVRVTALACDCHNL